MRRYVYIARALFGVLNETVRRYVTHRRIRARVADPRPLGDGRASLPRGRCRSSPRSMAIIAGMTIR